MIRDIRLLLVYPGTGGSGRGDTNDDAHQEARACSSSVPLFFRVPPPYLLSACEFALSRERLELRNCGAAVVCRFTRIKTVPSEYRRLRRFPVSRRWVRGGEEYARAIFPSVYGKNLDFVKPQGATGKFLRFLRERERDLKVFSFFLFCFFFSRIAPAGLLIHFARPSHSDGNQSVRRNDRSRPIVIAT